MPYSLIYILINLYFAYICITLTTTVFRKFLVPFIAEIPPVFKYAFLCVYIHTYTHTYKHACIHTNTHTHYYIYRIHTCINTHLYIHYYIHTHTLIYSTL